MTMRSTLTAWLPGRMLAPSSRAQYLVKQFEKEAQGNDLRTRSTVSVNLGSEKCVPICGGYAQAYVRNGINVRHGTGIFGSVARLLSYDPEYVRELSFFTVLDLTVFSSIWFWLQSAFYMSITIMLYLLPYDEEFGASLYQVLELLDDGFRSLLAFVLGGFVSLSVSTWKERRTNYASLIGSSRTLLLLFASLLEPTPHDTERDLLARRAAKRTLGRYVLLATELAVLKACAQMDTAAGKLHLERYDLLQEGEWAAMAAGDRHTAVYGWILKLSKRLAGRGMLSQQELKSITDAVVAARGQANDLMSSLNRDVPYPYAQMVGLMMRFYITLASMRFGIVAKTRVGGIKAFGLLANFMYVLIFLGLHDIFKTLHNPFLHRRIDVGHEPIMGGLRALAKHLLLEGDSPQPPSLQEWEEHLTKSQD